MAYPLTNSIQFDNASSEYATASDSSSLSITGDITIEFWVKMNETLTSGQSRCLVVKSGLSSSNRGYELIYQNVSGVTSLFFYIFSGGTPTNFFEGIFQFTLTQDEWFHVAMTCDVSAAAASKMKWYINGADMGAGVGTNFGSGTTSIFDSSNALRIGQGDAVIAGYYPDAQFGLVRLWSTLRSQSEINTNKNTVLGSTTNLQAEWTLDNTYADNSGNSNTLSGVNTPTFISDVPTSTTGFKMATVNASDVPATQTNFPAYVDLSRLGVDNYAEAQSIRVYADEAKTTEWAREIVSKTEMHVKVPSLTSTTDIYIDWDTDRADYAITDTYGRNNVWSDYRAVHHLDNVNDSTANGYNLTNNNTVAFGAGLLGNAADTGTGNTNKYLSILNDLGITGGAITQSVWVQMNAEIASSYQYFSNQSDTGVDVQYQFSYDYNGGTRRMQFTRLRQNVVGNDALNTVTLGTTWHKIDLTYDGTTVRSYIDGVAGNTVASSGDGTGATIDNFYLFAVRSGGAIIGYASCKLDESRIRGAALSANWLTTEYNNQSDEAGFWGTWSDVGGGATFVPLASFFM